MNYAQINVEVQEQEHPYPVTAVNDLREHYSAENFRFAIQQCRNGIAIVRAEENLSDQQVARLTILRVF